MDGPPDAEADAIFGSDGVKVSLVRGGHRRSQEMTNSGVGAAMARVAKLAEGKVQWDALRLRQGDA